LNNIPNLPKHNTCKNCGWCCCIVPITASEDLDIRQYVKKIDYFAGQCLVNQPRDQDECQFHDRNKRRCAIYLVRPKICRMFGSVLGMNCPHGNSANLNSKQLLTKQPVMLMPEYIDRKISKNNSVPLAKLPVAKDYFRQVAYLLSAAKVQYKFTNPNHLFQLFIEIDKTVLCKKNIKSKKFS